MSELRKQFINNHMKKYEIKSVLFLGIGGISMYQLALAFKNMGVKCYGYDIRESKYTKICENAGIDVVYKFNKNVCNVDLCIKTGAIKDSKFLEYLEKKNIRIVDRSVALGWISGKFQNVIAVAGTHGKTTTATLIYEMLKSAGKKVSCHIGAEIEDSRFSLGDDYLVVEACEYNKSFLSLCPDIAVVTNVEAEHMDSYGSMFNLHSSFIKFVKRASNKFAYKENSTKFLSKIKDIKFVDNIDCVESKLKGEYNKKNISLAVAVALDLGVDKKVINRVISTFSGVKRRYEYIGEYGESKIFIDYAHHPTELKAFSENFLNEYRDGLIVFQPHTYSRTKTFLNEFIEVLTDIKNLIIFKEYPAREMKSQGMSARELYEILKGYNSSIKYSASTKAFRKMLSKHSAISFVGAGDIDLVARKIVKHLQKTLDK